VRKLYISSNLADANAIGSIILKYTWLAIFTCKKYDAKCICVLIRLLDGLQNFSFKRCQLLEVRKHS
jgi:hypothetical protein